MKTLNTVVAEDGEAPRWTVSGRGNHSPRWAMVIDLRKCNGCECCVANCSEMNSLSFGAPWRRVAQWEALDQIEPRRVFLPLHCMHCANPPCMEVCPTGATYQRQDGIVDIDAKRCMGCAYCVVACPYLARVISPLGHAVCATPSRDGLGEDFGQRGADQDGTCLKCNLCAPKIDRGLEKGLTPGVDAEATPTCVVSCLPRAVSFGNINDPQSAVSKLLQENKVSRVSEQLGTEPSLYYIVD